MSSFKLDPKLEKPSALIDLQSHLLFKKLPRLPAESIPPLIGDNERVRRALQKEHSSSSHTHIMQTLLSKKKKKKRRSLESAETN